MNTRCMVALVLLLQPLGCAEEEADDAGLFGDGGTSNIPTPTSGGEDDGTTSDADSGDTPPPPPPPPPPPGDDSGSGDGMPPGTDTGMEDESTTGDTGGGSDGNDTFNDGTLDVQVINQSMFPQGQCDDVVITNVSAMAVTWEVTLPLPGTIDMSWNCEVMEMDGNGIFTGADFNATLEPGAQAMLGYCVLY